MSWTSAYGHRARVFDVAFDHSGTRFATASEDSTARIWREVPSDAAQPGYEQEACLTGHGAEVLRVGWNHDGTMLATGCADTKARIWTLRDDYGSTCETTLEPHPEELYCSEWLHLRPQPDNNHFLTASGSVVKVWDLERSTQLQEVPMQSGETDEELPEAWRERSIFGCAQSDTGLAACPCSDGRTRVLAARGATSHLDCVHTLACSLDIGNTCMCMAAAFSADGFLLAVVTSEGCVLVYDVRTWEAVYKIGVGPGVMSISWCRLDDLNHMLVTHGSRVLQIQMPSGTTTVYVSGSQPHKLLCHSYSQESNRLVAAGEVIAAAPEDDAAADMALPPPSDLTAGAVGDSTQQLAMLLDTSLTVSRPGKAGRAGKRRAAQQGKAAPASVAAATASVPESAVGRCPVDVWQL